MSKEDIDKIKIELDNLSFFTYNDETNEWTYAVDEVKIRNFLDTLLDPEPPKRWREG